MVKRMLLSVVLAVPMLLFAPGAHAQQTTPDVAGLQTRGGETVRRPGLARAATPLDRLIAIDARDEPLGKVLRTIDEQADLGLSYTPRVVPVSRRVTLRADRITVRQALAAILGGTNVEAITNSAGHVVLLKRSTADGKEVAVDGVIYGTVADSATDAPLVGALVGIVGTNVTHATDDHGRYELLAVPPGEHVVVVRHLGYRKGEKRVTVRDGERLQVDFPLVMTTSRLQEVVTTGSGERQRLEVGNSIGSINADSIVPFAPIRNLSDLLAGRVAGMQVSTTNGMMGTGSRIRIRGMANIYGGGSDPIMIVDGMRVDARYSVGFTSDPTPPAGNMVNSTIMATSRIDDLDPSEIESIDILRGPSAASLYGSDAANGVIVIKTKRGRPGPTRWTFSADGSRITMPAKFSESYFGWGVSQVDPTIQQCFVPELFPMAISVSNGGCTMDSVSHWNPLNHAETTPFGVGSNYRYSGQASGGSERLRYYFSGSYETGTDLLKMPDNAVAYLKRERNGDPIPEWQMTPSSLASLRFSNNLDMQLAPRLNVALSTSFARRDHQGTDGGPGGFVASGNMSRGVRDSLGGWGQANPARIFSQKNTDQVNRWMTSLRTDWNPFDRLSLHATLGADYANRTDELLVRPGDIPDDEQSAKGRHSRYQGTMAFYTVDLGGSLTSRLPWGWSARTSVGGQYTRTNNSGVTVDARGLAFGSDVATDAEQIVARENFDAMATAGWYVEQGISRNDRLYITAALRGDVGSAFGKLEKTPLFPKFSASWLISEEPFFPSWIPVTSLRLRTAYGHAGVQPSQNMVFRTYIRQSGSVHGESTPVINLITLGNERLKPERGTEWEGGLDVSFLDDRLSFEGTIYRKITRDALMQMPLPPSFGQAARTQNIGKVENRGLEATVGITPIRYPAVTWSTSLTMSKNKNQVVSVNGPVLKQKGFNMAIPGYPVGSNFDYAIVAYADADGNGIIDPSEVQYSDSVMFMGQQQPKVEITLHNDLSFFSGKVRLSAGLDYKGGLTQENFTMWQRCLQQHCRGLFDPTASLAEQAMAVSSYRTEDAFRNEVSWLRLYELSLSFIAPDRVTQLLHARSASISIMGRNLGMWTHYRGADPELTSFPYGEGTMDMGGVPQPREWAIRLNIGF